MSFITCVSQIFYRVYDRGLNHSSQAAAYCSTFRPSHLNIGGRRCFEPSPSRPANEKLAPPTVPLDRFDRRGQGPEGLEGPLTPDYINAKFLADRDTLESRTIVEKYEADLRGW